MGEAYVTASTDYLDVVLFHGVVVLVPLFIAWVLILSRYDFSPFAVFLLFGIMGIVCETAINPAGAITGVAMWIFIYGLMVYLPTYCIPPERGARKPMWYHHLLAIPRRLPHRPASPDTDRVPVGERLAASDRGSFLAFTNGNPRDPAPIPHPRKGSGKRNQAYQG